MGNKIFIILVGDHTTKVAKLLEFEKGCPKALSKAFFYKATSVSQRNNFQLFKRVTYILLKINIY